MGNAYLLNKILLVDDNLEILQLLQRALARRKMSCDLARDGEEAQHLLDKNDYEVAFIDLRIPKKNGHKIIVELLRLSKRPYIFCITGLNDPKIFADLFERGVDDILLKPFQLDFVALKTKSILRKRQQLSEHHMAQTHDEVSKNLEDTASSLKRQLEDIQDSFASTISSLEKRRDELEAGYLDSVRVLTGLMEQLGSFKGSHAVRVEKIAMTLAKRLRLDRKSIHNLKIAALLHDIGQFGMPDSIRSKPPWMLVGEEKTAYESYPVIGSTLLSEIRGSDKIVDIIEGHAENYDGSGFPANLRGDDIPLGARILRLADGTDTALMHAGEVQPKEFVRVHLMQNKGGYYDPKLVSHMIAALPFEYAEAHVDKTVSESIRELMPGAVLAENVYDNHGRFLAREGAVVTSGLLRHLQHLVGFQKVRIIKETGEEEESQTEHDSEEHITQNEQVDVDS